MFTQDDFIDALLEALQASRPGPAKTAVCAAPAPGLSGLSTRQARSGPSKPWSDGFPEGRPFLSEHDIKKMLTPGSQVLRIPPRAILSPLAQDWLALKGIRILAE